MKKKLGLERPLGKDAAVVLRFIQNLVGREVRGKEAKTHAKDRSNARAGS